MAKTCLLHLPFCSNTFVLVHSFWLDLFFFKLFALYSTLLPTPICYCHPLFLFHWQRLTIFLPSFLSIGDSLASSHHSSHCHEMLCGCWTHMFMIKPLQFHCGLLRTGLLLLMCWLVAWSILKHLESLLHLPHKHFLILVHGWHNFLLLAYLLFGSWYYWLEHCFFHDYLLCYIPPFLSKILWFVAFRCLICWKPFGYTTLPLPLSLFNASCMNVAFFKSLGGNLERSLKSLTLCFHLAHTKW